MNMITMDKRCVLSSAVLLLCFTALVTVTESQLIPDDVCTILADIFKSLGCLDEKPGLCRYMAMLFTFHTPTGGILCDKFLCDGGYGQSEFDTQCQESTCPENKKRPRGICPACSSCCTIEV